MRARRWALTTALSAVLLTASVPQRVEVLDAPGPIDLTFVGAEPAYAKEAQCEITICFEVDLGIVSGKVCFTKEFACK